MPIICSDAPDWAENPADDPTIDPQLKTVRLPLEEAISCISPLELLLATPTELRKGQDRANSSNLSERLWPDGETSSVMPEPFKMPTSDKRDPGMLFHDCRIATHVEARANKRRHLPTAAGVRDPHYASSIVAPLHQCKKNGQKAFLSARRFFHCFER